MMLQASFPPDALYPVKVHVYGHKSHKASRASKGVKFVDFRYAQIVVDARFPSSGK